MEEINFNQDLREVEQEYKREVAIIKARPIIYKLLIFLWMLFDVVLLGLFISFVVGYLAVGQFSDRTSTANTIKNLFTIHSSAQDLSAKSLLIGNTTAVNSIDSYDFTASISNPNTDWYADFDYAFAGSAGSTHVSHGFIFPGENRQLITLQQKFDVEPRNFELVVTNLKWTRLDAHMVGDLNEWYSQHNDFIFSDVSHGTIRVGSKNVTSSNITVKNNSPYGYWSAPFTLLLERNGAIVGVNQFSIAGFEAGETRQITINWFDSAPSSGDLHVTPSIDYLDSEIYMPAQAEPGTDIRD